MVVIVNGPCGIGKASCLASRDALRANPGLRREYQDLKHALRTKYKHDRATYSESKGAFVEKVLARWRSRGLETG